MTSHALTPEQETMLKMAAFQIRDSFPAHSLYMEVLRDLARTLLEPLEKERDEARFAAETDTAIVGAQAATILRLRAQLAEAREENTRLREQLGKIGWIEAALKEIAQDTGQDCMGREEMREIVYRHRAVAP